MKKNHPEDWGELIFQERKNNYKHYYIGDRFSFSVFFILTILNFIHPIIDKPNEMFSAYWVITFLLILGTLSTFRLAFLRIRFEIYSEGFVYRLLHLKNIINKKRRFIRFQDIISVHKKKFCICFNTNILGRLGMKKIKIYSGEIGKDSIYKLVHTWNEYKKFN